jgi:hypothetical protein
MKMKRDQERQRTRVTASERERGISTYVERWCQMTRTTPFISTYFEMLRQKERRNRISKREK